MTSLPLDVGDLEAFQAGNPQFSLEAAVAAVRSYCRWHIAPVVTETVSVQGSGAGTLILPTLRLTGVASVTDDLGVAADLTLAKWSTAGVIQSTYWWSAWRKFTVVFTHGYDALPADVRGVILSLADAGTSGVGGRVRQVGQVTYDNGGSASADDLTGAQKAILDRYRLPSRP